VKNYLILSWDLQDLNISSKLFKKIEFCVVNISYKSSIATLLLYWFSENAFTTTGVERLQHDIFVLIVLTFDLFRYCQHFKGKNEKAMW